MFDSRRFIEFLREYFPEGVLASGGREFVCRCRVCGDSLKDSSKMRFYISLNDPSGMIFYHCFNCGIGGILTVKFMRSICNAPSEILLMLADLNKKYKKTRYLPKEGIFKIEYEDVLDDDLNKAKLEYINGRLGLDLSYREWVNNKIVFSLGNLIQKNRLQLTQPYDKVKDYDSFYIGALSINNSVCYLRCVNPIESTVKKRHVKYLLMNNYDIKRYFTIPCECNWASHIRINLSEGLFDCLGIYFHLRECNKTNEINTAVGSKAYISAIKMYLQEYGFLDCEFHIYADNDVEDRILNHIRDYCAPLQIPVYRHYNAVSGEKDYGVTADRIDDKQYTLVKV